MAVDKKSRHVGNHGGAYTDIDGMSKQFTYIDHDKKTKVSTHKDKPGEAAKALKEYSERLALEILALPAVNALKNSNGLYEEFVTRDRENGISWNENSIKEVCSINWILGLGIFQDTWRRTVKEQYWYDEMPHVDILQGQWKKW